MPLSSRTLLFSSALAMLAAAAVGCADLDTPLGPVVRPQSTPLIGGLTPGTVTRGVAATVTVTGAGFLPEATAFVGTAVQETPEFVATQVPSVDFISTTKLVLHLSATLPAGRLNVTVINPDDGVAVKIRGLTVQMPSKQEEPRARPKEEDVRHGS